MKYAILAITISAVSTSASAASCNCWQTNGTSADYYTHYRFFDYRNISNVPAVPDLISTDAPDHGESSAFQGGFIDSVENFGDFWTTETFNYTKDDDNAYQAQASKANVYIQSKNSHDGDYKEDIPDSAISWLTLRTSRPAEDFATMAQITSKDTFLYGTMRFAGRVIGLTGACAGFFSYALEDGDNNESDIEILTKDTDYADGKEVHYTNQPSDINGVDTGTSVNATLERPFWEWQTHRFDWRESATDFYGDAGRHKLGIERNVPSGEAQFTVNMWSTGNEWTDRLGVGDVAEFHISWIEWAFNTTSGAARCEELCLLDGEEVGYLSPSRFAEDQVALNGGSNVPVAIPVVAEDGAGEDAEDTGPENGGSRLGRSSMAFIVGVVLVAMVVV